MVADRTMDAEAAALAYDVEVVSRWDARVAEAVLPRLPVPASTTALVAQCRTGFACEALLAAQTEQLRLMAVDDSRFMLDRARARLQDTAGIYFSSARASALSFATGVFGLGVCLAAPSSAWAFDGVVGELLRVMRTESPLALAGATGRGLDLLYEATSEALHAAGLETELARPAQHCAERLGPESAELSLRRRGASILASGVLDVPLVLTSARSILDSPLAAALFGDLRASLFGDLPEAIEEDVRHRLDTYLRGLAVEVRLEALWIVARTGAERIEAVFDADDLDLVELDDEAAAPSSESPTPPAGLLTARPNPPEPPDGPSGPSSP
jgi:SAM-dependent methyltransferase